MKRYKGLLLSFLIVATIFVGCSSCSNRNEEKANIPEVEEEQVPDHKYTNPVASYSLPDPTVIQGEDGYFYLYATEDIPLLPILKSRDLVEWELIGTAFDEKSRPSWEPNAGIWAPDINFVGGQYVMYYSMSVWGGEWTCGIGVATADKPEGPFTDHGKLFRSNEIGVQNSIDPCLVTHEGKNYLFWGSFRGINYIELTEDGLELAPGAEPTPVAGTAYEAVYIHEREGDYYMFASIGTCCEGANSTYTTVVGRAESPFGPYVDKAGQPMLENHHEVVLHKSNKFVGTGHNSRLITDKNGEDWMLYHAFDVEDPSGRLLFMDKIVWDDEGWPTVKGLQPSETSDRPLF
ncbi:MAG: family 43 glycosylhydrolase [Porphyromonas sp.]|nr:family 43 glycosylhydrolase [Porphyromonas sp.]